MRLEQLIYLTEVIKLKNMHAASQTLYTSVQNISKSLKNLEAELGVPLLYRTKHGFEPTGDGKIVYEKALQVRQCVEDLQHMYLTADSSPKTDTHDVSIAAVCSMTIRLRHIIKQLNQKSPSTSFSLCEYEGNYLNSFFQIPAQPAMDFDFFFLACGQKTLPNFVAQLKDYEVYVLCSDDLGLNINRKNPLSREKHIPLAALNTVPLASFQVSVTIPPLFFTILKENDFNFLHKPKYVSNLHEVCDEYVEQNKAAVISCVPNGGSENYHPDNTNRVTIPFKESVKIVHLMVFSKNKPLSAGALQFKKTVLSFFADTQYKYAN